MKEAVQRTTMTAVVLALSLTASAADLPDRVGFFRQMEILIPFTSAKFTIDGAVSGQEKAACAMARQFVTYEADARGDNQSSVWLAHTGSRLYLGFDFNRPEGKPPIAKAAGRDDKLLWKNDDAVEVMILTKDKGVDLVGNSAGVCGDYQISPQNMAWSHESWQYAARTTETGWEGEFLIGADVLGLPAFTPDLDMRIDVVNNAKSLHLTSLAYRGGAWQANQEYYPRARLGTPGQVYRRVSELGAMENGRIGIKSMLANPSTEKRSVKIWTALFRAKENKEKPYYSLASGLFSKGGIAVAPGATDDEVIRRILAPFLNDCVQAGAIDKTVDIAGGSSETVELWRRPFPGTYLVAESYRDAGSGQTIAAGVYPFSITPPLPTDLEFYYLTTKRVYALTLLPFDPSVRQLRYTVLNAADGKKVSEKSVDVAATGQRVKTAISSAEWPAGAYRMDIEALGAGGSIVSRNSLAFEKPETPEWFGGDAGRRIAVSYPWTPVEAGEKETRVSGRRYAWNDGPFMDQIASRDTELLAAPIRLTGQTQGRPLTWSGGETKLETKTEALAVYRSRWNADALALDVKTTVEFDGMCRFDLTLSAKSKARLDDLFLEIPVRRDVARFFSRADLLGLAPENEAPKEWESLPSAGRIPEKPFSLPFTPSIVVRNDKVGIEWFAEWDWGWSNRSRENRIEIAPQSDATVLRVRFIDQPTSIEAPREITFGIQVWPVRPWPGKEMNVSNYLVGAARNKDGSPSFNEDLGATYEQFVANMKKAKDLGMDVMWIFHWNAWRSPDGSISHPPEYPVLLSGEVERKVKAYGEATQSLGLPVIGHAGFGLPPTAPVFGIYGKEMARRPIVIKGVWGYKFTADSPFPDAWVHGFKKLAEQYGWSGVQLDGAFSVHYNETEETGSAVRDENGKLHGRYPIFAYRDFARRLYNVYHGEVRFPGIERGFVYCHLGSHAMGAIHGFCDAIHCGEDRETMLVKHLGEIDLDRQRAIYASGALGVPRHLLSKVPKAPVGPQGRIAFALQLDMTMPHTRILAQAGKEGYDRNAFPAHRLWAARKWIGATPDNFVWYDESRRYLSVEAPSIYASLHLQPGRRVLVALGNWKAIDQTANVRLDLAALGMEGKPLTAQDAVTLDPIKMDGGVLSLEIKGDMYRLIKIGAEEAPFSH